MKISGPKTLWLGSITVALISDFTLPAIIADEIIYPAAYTGEIKSSLLDDAYFSSQAVMIIPLDGPEVL